ncbi:MAG: glycosyltransferase [Candidatus Sericytochromatia bacterium]
MRKKILYFTDCSFFGGCENILVNLINNDIILSNYDIYFSYRDSLLYKKEVNNRFNKNIKAFPIKLLTNDSELYRFFLKKSDTKNKLSSFLFKLISKLMRITKDIGIYSLYNFIVIFLIIVKIKPDIVHINNGGYPGAFTCKIFAIVSKLLSVKKIIFTVNNLAYPQNNFIDRFIDKIVDKSVTIFTTASNAAKVVLNKRRNFPISKIINIPNTLKNELDLDKIKEGKLRNEFSISKETIIVGSVGLLTKRKGFHILIKSIVNIVKNLNDKNIIFFIFGDGEERINLEEQIKLLNLENKIKLPGHKSNILDYVKDFDLFVLPSIDNEDFPYVIIEAMLLEKAIISTNVAGIPEQVKNNDNGYIVEPLNEKELSEKIEKLILDENERYIMGKKSKERYKNLFSYKEITNKYLDIYKSL